MTLRVTVKGGKEAQHLLESVSGRELTNRQRRSTRAGAAVLRTALRAKARGGQYPRTFREIATRSSTRGGIRTSVGPRSPLHRIFEGGATGHRIAPKAAGSIRRGTAGAHVVDGGSHGVLSNLNDRGPGEQPFFATHPVHHPGMAARPLTTPVFEANKDKAAEVAMAKLLEGLR